MMSDTREARASATEKKFLLDASAGARVREWARARLQADPYGGGPFADEYHTSSLYFDTANLDVFHRRGSFGRAKFRIRRYAGADYAYVERKLRRPKLLIKRRTRVDLDIVDALARGELSETSPASWFNERLQVRRLVPACLLSYHRTARGIETANGLARLTIDDGVHVVPASDFSLLDAGLTGVPLLPGQVILELKYRGRLPAIFVELVSNFNLQWRTVSKYRLGMRALGNDFSDTDPEELTEVDALGN